MKLFATFALALGTALILVAGCAEDVTDIMQERCQNKVIGGSALASDGR